MHFKTFNLTGLISVEWNSWKPRMRRLCAVTEFGVILNVLSFI